MKISRMKVGSWGKLKAFFDIETEEGFIIKGFKIIDGINGLFVSMPSEKDKEGEYNDTVLVLDKKVRKELHHIAVDHYENTLTSDGTTRQVGGVSEHYADNDDRGEIGHVNTQNVKDFENNDDVPF